jgi:hypothetical protein
MRGEMRGDERREEEKREEERREERGRGEKERREEEERRERRERRGEGWDIGGDLTLSKNATFLFILKEDVYVPKRQTCP